MPAVETSQIPLGYKASNFHLIDTVSGELKSLHELSSNKATVVAFLCNHCPYVKHIFEGFVDLANEYMKRGISFIAISSNDFINYPDDSPINMKLVAVQYEFPFPYLFDETQQTAKDYHAECTPDFSIFNGSLACVYRGQLDGARPNNQIPVTGIDIRNALDALLKEEKVPENQVPSLGCSIKWKH